MDFGFKGKVAVITGGTSGIGAETALAFAREGAAVVVAGRRESEGSKVIQKITDQGGRGLFVAADVANEEDVKNLFSHAQKAFNRVDYVFANAGIEGHVGVASDSFTTENYKKVFDVNVAGVFLTIKYAVPLLEKSNGGSIVVTSSVAGMRGMPGMSVYVASKHAVLGIVKSAALELATKGIRVNAVSPAAIETEMFDRFVSPGGEEAKEYMKSLHPVGRVGVASEVAAAVLYLSASQSSFITGMNLPVDGGFTAK